MLIKFLLIFLSATTLIFSKSSLKDVDSKLKKYNSELAEVSQRLKKEERDLVDLKEELKKLQAEITRGRSKFNKEKKELEKYSKDKDSLFQKQLAVRKMAIETSAKLVSLSVVLEEGQSATLDSVILDEAFKTLFKQKSGELEKITENLSKRQEAIGNLEKVVGELQSGIHTVEQKRDAVLKKKKELAYRVGKLKKDKENYFHRIKEIEKEQKRIRAEIDKATRLQKEKENRKTSSSSSKYQVKKIDSSYQKEQVRRYRKKKTISPLDGYEVIKTFGTYKDPIYKIKLFNSYILLQPRVPNAKVRNIFNGKVSLVKDDAIFGKLVVVEHYNGLQTVYAHLSKFAPNIETGKKIKKGALIGRVNQDLYLEIMEGRFHINPLQVIE
ncbi:metalloendopeptidase-like membrane protein [Thiovulum sp. ES]|nr:metalloendopeptidase-like membrane protein [Thiovulum sp. ES]